METVELGTHKLQIKQLFVRQRKLPQSLVVTRLISNLPSIIIGRFLSLAQKIALSSLSLRERQIILRTQAKEPIFETLKSVIYSIKTKYIDQLYQSLPHFRVKKYVFYAFPLWNNEFLDSLTKRSVL